MSDDHAAGIRTDGSVAVGGAAAGDIETTRDRDWFAVELVAGRTYVFDLEGNPTGAGTLSDTYLHGIHDADGNLISGTTNDDGGEYYNSRLTFTATESGTHYVAAGAYGTGTGTYELSVRDTDPDTIPEPDTTPVPQTPQQTQAPADADAVRADATELGDITGLAGPAFPTGRLDGGADAVDYFRFTLTEAKQIGLGLRQQDTNADLLLEDAEGNVLHDSTEAGTASEWIGETLLAGTYYVRIETQETGQNDYVFRYGVTAADPEAVRELERLLQEENAGQVPAFGQQDYVLALAENADGSTSRVSLGTVSATDPEGSTVSYSLVGGNEAGLFGIDAASGELFYVGAGEDYETGATSFDLTVRASDGDRTTDTGVTVNVTDVAETVEVAPPVTQPDQSTPQTASEPAGEDFSAATSTSGRVAVGDTATGNIETNSDRDWFAVELVAGRSYTIDLRGSPTGDGTLLDTYLRGIHDADGNVIPGTTNDDGGEGYNSRLTFTATESGTHYIAAGAFSSRGTYEVEVTDHSPPIVVSNPIVQEPPAFSQPGYAFDLAENADGSTQRVSLGIVAAVDPDGTAVEYSLVAGNGSGLFQIEAATDELFYTGSGEDYESGTTPFALRVRASDGTLFTDMTVTVNVTDMPEQAIVEAPVAQTPPQAGATDLGDITDLAGPAFPTGALDDGADAVDYFRFTLSEAKGVHFGLRQQETNADLFLEDEDGVVIASMTTAGTANEELPRTLLSGTYFVRIEAQEAGSSTYVFRYGVNAPDPAEVARLQAQMETQTGFVAPPQTPTEPEAEQQNQSTLQTVSESAGEDFSSATGTAGVVALGGSATGEIGEAYDRDWFAVDLTAGTEYRIDLEGSITGAGTLWDPYLRGIYDSNGQLLPGTANNNVGDLNSRVYFEAPTDGTYYVAAGSYGCRRGTYTLSVAAIVEDGM